jgi:hypothetical protein
MGKVGMEYSLGKAWPMAEEADSRFVWRGNRRAPDRRIGLPLMEMESLESMESAGETPRILDNSYKSQFHFSSFFSVFGHLFITPSSRQITVFDWTVFNLHISKFRPHTFSRRICDPKVPSQSRFGGFPALRRRGSICAVTAQRRQRCHCRGLQRRCRGCIAGWLWPRRIGLFFVCSLLRLPFWCLDCSGVKVRVFCVYTKGFDLGWHANAALIIL